MFKVQGSRFNVDELKRVINFFKYFEINLNIEHRSLLLDKNLALIGHPDKNRFFFTGKIGKNRVIEILQL